MVDIVYDYCQHWNVSINVDKSSERRSQPEVNILYGNRSLVQTDSFVHLGIVYSYNLKDKDRVSQRLQKAKNALFAMSAQGFHAQGVNPKVSVDIYFNVFIPNALYGVVEQPQSVFTMLGTKMYHQHKTQHSSKQVDFKFILCMDT